MEHYARVITDDPTDKELDYLIPNHWVSKIQTGTRVRVPLRSRESSATVIAVVQQPSVAQPKAVSNLLSDGPVITEKLLQLARWMSDYYGCTLEAAVRCVLPQVIRSAQVGFRREKRFNLGYTPTLEEIELLKKKAPRQAEVWEALATAGKALSRRELLRSANTTDRAIQELIKRGWITMELTQQDRDPYGAETFVPSQPLSLNPAQSEALKQVIASIEQRHSKPLLLHGVTGSGKTEIYLQAIQYCISKQAGALVLVPEISLTPQTVERFKMRFSNDLIAVLHSHLSDGERHDEWYKIHTGHAKIAIGARSAIFAPVHNLGLIVVDEEHENSYKQEETPRYHARDLAVVRAQLENCPVLLGSATPSIESYHNTRSGKYGLIQLKTRVDDREMPLIRIVDMRKEFQKQKSTTPLISTRLGIAIEERLTKKEQTILFLNRRGYATSLVCNQCGHVCECPNCSIALTYHAGESRLKCHICSHIAVAPRKCPECSDPGIRYAGFGTEKVENTVKKIFPKAATARMDADTMNRKDAYRETLKAFRTGKIDILIGTQMIAKGLDFPNVTLVGIINADVGLHLPDFRAGERTFQLLTQVAGRAGRGEMEGEVYVQSATPFSPSIQFARHHDFDGYWEQEIEFRERCEYPPFVHMLMVHIRSEHQRRAEFSAETLHRRLEEQLSAQVTLHPWGPAPIERTKNYFRYQILMRTRSILKLSRKVKAILNNLTFPEDVFVTVDVDPYQLL
jgi:primosomal protein N' (replication factor Y) (superfamily II helicase)